MTLLFVGAALIATLTPGAAALLRLDPFALIQLVNPRWYLGVLGHVFVHQNIAHFVGNVAMLLLLGPSLERAMGSDRFAAMLGVLIVLTGLSASFILMFTQRSLIGASGLVFALIFMNSLRGAKKYEIPVSVILLAALWGAKEVVGLFDQSRIANSAHLNGALWGFLAGMSGFTRDRQ